MWSHDTVAHPPVVEMPQELINAGFTVTEHHLEIAGTCKDCKNKG